MEREPERLLHTPTLAVLGAWCAGAALLAMAVGAAVLLGVLPDLPPVKVNAALCFVLCGWALWRTRSTARALDGRGGSASTAAALAAALIGTLTLGEYLGRVDLGIDELLLRDVTPGESPHPGRMSPFTALCFVMLGLAIAALDRPRLFRMGQRLAVASGFIAFLNVVGYWYSIHLIPYTGMFPRYTGMAILTATCLVVLSIGVTAARPGRGATGIFAQATAGGAVARVLLPVAAVGPFVVGAIRLAGERAGYYGTDFGVALMAVANIVLFSVIIWWTARNLHRTDVRRHLAEAEVRRSNEELEARVRARTAELAASEARYRQLFASSVMGLLIHWGGSVRFANAAAARILGYAGEDELVGRRTADLVVPESRAEVQARIEARLRGEPVEETVQFEVLRVDGSRLWVESTASLVEWDGEPSSLVAFIDVSERRRREEVEREAASLRTVAQLANAAAHEINNPLMIIAGNVELLGVTGSPSPENRSRVERCTTAIRRIADMIGHMTRITHLETFDLAGGVSALDLRRSSQENEEKT